MRNCPRCGRENGEDVRFCGRCGLDLHEYAQAQGRPAVETTAFCYRHPKVSTNLSCGRCERPICTKCAIMGPAGIRCPDCARHKVAVRPGAVVHEARRSLFSLGRIGGRMGPYMLMILASLAFGAFRSCNRPDVRDRDEEPYEERPAPEERRAPERGANGAALRGDGERPTRG